jgi:Ca2+-transporting ATPase
MADAIEIAAGVWGAKISKLKGWRRTATIPFDSAHKYGASESINGKKVRLVMRGAPEIILEYCRIKENDKKQLIKRGELGSEGYRLIAMAELREGKLDSAIKSKTWKYLGIIVMEDPIRIKVAEEIPKLKQLGVRFCVITGDFAQTAEYVMKKLGIETENKVIVGSEFRALSNDEQKKIVESTILFARFAPEDKLRVVEILKEQGQVVAMMGDGINDAPALKLSDVGIVVSSASEVSKETADMVLLDNRFGTVIAGIEEGRSIFERIKRVIRYLLSDSLDEVVVITTSMIAGLPLPVTAAQILWINLANDTFPAMALAFDPVDSRKLKVEQNGKAGFFDLSSKILVGVVSLVSGLIV